MFRRCVWVMKLAWGYLSVLPQLVRGACRVSRLSQPVVSVFGGSRISGDSEYAWKAEQISNMLAGEGISVLTGGGPGIMEAANCGAARNNGSGNTVGIALKQIMDREKPNMCAEHVVVTTRFPVRKHLLIHYSYAFLVFPGGFGTMDELAELVTLMETGYREVAPIVLFGSDYWQYVIRWVEKAQEEGLVTPTYTDFVTVTDDLEEAYSLLLSHCERCNEGS